MFGIFVKFCTFRKKGSAWWPEYFGSYWLQKMCLFECELVPVSQHPWRVNVFTVPKHYWNMHGRTFIQIFHYSKTNWVGKYLSESDSKCYGYLLRGWRRSTCILLIVERNSCKELKRNYLKNQKQVLKVLLHFWNLQKILHILKKRVRVMAQLFWKLLTLKNVLAWMQKKLFFQNTFLESKCLRVGNTAQICTALFLS